MDKIIQQIVDLLKQGHCQQSAELYHQQSNQLDAQAQQWLDSLFGLALLSGQNQLLQSVSPDSAVINDYAAAKRALEAYSQNQNAQVVQELLRKLSYDSPYKDLRLIVSTLLDIDNSPESLNKLGAITKTSPYSQITELIRLAVDHSTDDLEPTGLGLSLEEQQLIMALRGHNTQPDQLLPHDSTPQQLFKWLMANPIVLDSTTQQSMSLNLLVNYPEGLDIYQERFGNLVDFDVLRLQALASEQSGDWSSAARWWDDCLQTVDSQQAEHREAMRQLIEQRVNQCNDQSGYDNPQQQASILEQRLQNNPDDNATCLKLLAHYRTAGDDQAYKQLVKQAITQFPQHPGIVAAAVGNATETVEFEEAARLARTLLDNDALNQDTRRMLIQAYLSYADKLALRGQRHASQTILDQTEALERPEPSGVVSLHRALMHYVVGEESKAEQQIELGCTQLGSYLNGYTQMAAETARLGFKKKYTKQYLKLIRSLVGYQPNAEEIVSLIQLLANYTKDSRIDSNELLSVLSPFLQRSLESDFSNDQLRLICTTLEQINAYEDLHRVALNATQRNDQADAEFEYYRIVGITRGNPAQINTEDSVVLEQLLDRLAEENPKLRTRIIEFLNANVLTGSATKQGDTDYGIAPHNTDISVDGIFSTIKRLFNQ
ncbi:MAG: hypothetical protein V3U88_08150 [Methylococcales bacterium]